MSKETRHGVVKWFDFVKRYGFVTLDGDKVEDAMLHLSALREHKVTEVHKGSAVTVEVERSERGVSVKRVVSISPPAYEVNGGAFVPAKVKWFDDKRGYGFLTQGEGTPDIFVHAATVKQSALVQLVPDQPVLVVTEPSARGPKASRIKAPDDAAAT